MDPLEKYLSELPVPLVRLFGGTAHEQTTLMIYSDTAICFRVFEGTVDGYPDEKD